jgi:ABC-type multidrug transport system ATPase subunit
LDAEHRNLLDCLIREAVGGGATVVIASHELERASALADRIVTVAGGAIAGVTVAGGGGDAAPQIEASHVA